MEVNGILCVWGGLDEHPCCNIFVKSANAAHVFLTSCLKIYWLKFNNFNDSTGPRELSLDIFLAGVVIFEIFIAHLREFCVFT